MCTNLIFFLQEENEIADMCPNFLVFFMRRMRLPTYVLMF